LREKAIRGLGEHHVEVVVRKRRGRRERQVDHFDAAVRGVGRLAKVAGRQYQGAAIAGDGAVNEVQSAKGAVDQGGFKRVEGRHRGGFQHHLAAHLCINEVNALGAADALAVDDFVAEIHADHLEAAGKPEESEGVYVVLAEHDRGCLVGVGQRVGALGGIGRGGVDPRHRELQARKLTEFAVQGCGATAAEQLVLNTVNVVGDSDAGIGNAVNRADRLERRVRGDAVGAGGVRGERSRDRGHGGNASRADIADDQTGTARPGSAGDADDLANVEVVDRRCANRQGDRASAASGRRAGQGRSGDGLTGAAGAEQIGVAGSGASGAGAREFNAEGDANLSVGHEAFKATHVGANDSPLSGVTPERSELEVVVDEQCVTAIRRRIDTVGAAFSLYEDEALL
jgi:hypothetical protein